MRIAVALRKRDWALSRMKDIYSRATHYGLTSAAINEEVAAVWESLNAVKAPSWIKSYLEGWRAAQTDNLYREHLVFGGKVEGVFYSTHHDRTDYYEKNGIAPCDYADDGRVKDRGHYWKSNLRPFFIDR